MQLYNGMSPNGFRVDIFLKEKAIEIPTTQIDIMGGGTRQPEYLKINPLGEVPALKLDDGRVLTETLAICRYLEAMHPETALFGKDATERAFVEMWTRRVELRVFNVIGDVGLHEFPLFADRIRQFPDYAAEQRQEYIRRLKWLDSEMSDGRPYIAGDNFSVADITMIAALVVGMFAQVDIPKSLSHLKKWEASMQGRPSFPALPG